MVLCWTSIDWGFEHVVLKGVGKCAFDISDDSRNDSYYRICHDGGSQFTSSEHVVSDAYLSSDEMFAYAIVNTFVMSADDDDVFFEAQFVGHRLVKLFSIGCGEDYLIVVALCFEGCDAGIQRLALYQHARCPSEGIVIDAPMLVGGVVS